MKLSVIFQPFAEPYWPQGWQMLHEQSLHPQPLVDARRVSLDESQIQTLIGDIQDFDIIEPRKAIGKPFLVIDLEVGKFGSFATSEHARFRHAQHELDRHRDFIVRDLPVEMLFKGVRKRPSGKRNRLAWLSDFAFWGQGERDRLTIESLFDFQLSEAA